MANDRGFLREEKKNQLRQNMVTNDRVRSVPVSWIEEHKKTVAVMAVIVALAAVTGLAAWLVIGKFWKFSSYDISWNTEVVNASSAQYVPFGDGVAVLSKDGATYYDSKGTRVWSNPYDMRSPRAAVQGDYILIYDLKGKAFSICNKTGNTGSGTTSQTITKGDIAQTGVTVLQTEDGDASLITYYRNDGSELQVSIRTLLQTDGYPLDVSISPGGQQLAVAYYSISQGNGISRVSFYDFEEGKGIADRVVGSFDYEETGSYMPKVVYLTNEQAFAVGDGCVSFFDTSARTAITRTDVEIDGEIQRMFYNDSYLGLVVLTQTGYVLDIFSTSGESIAHLAQGALHSGYIFQEKNVVMYDSDYCEVQSFSGRVRFEKKFENTLYTVVPAAQFRSYYVATGEELQRIRLR